MRHNVRKTRPSVGGRRGGFSGTLSSLSRVLGSSMKDYHDRSGRSSTSEMDKRGQGPPPVPTQRCSVLIDAAFSVSWSHGPVFEM